jgi:hypothetical protein
MTTFKFIRHRNGISSFAEVGLEVVHGVAETVLWSVEVASFMPIYGSAVSMGVGDALKWHMAGGGRSASFRVTSIVELLVDTKPDAIRCAATAAAWIALGHDEAQLSFEFDTNWSVILIASRA